MQKHHKNHVLVISDKKYKTQNQMKKLLVLGILSVTLLAGCEAEEESFKEDCVEVKDYTLGTSSVNTAVLVHSKINDNEYQLASTPSKVASMRKGNVMKIKYNDKMRLRDFDFIKSCGNKEEK